MDFLDNKRSIFILAIVAITIVAKIKANDGEMRPVESVPILKTSAEDTKYYQTSAHEGSIRVKRQYGGYGYDPYYYGRRRPYPPVIFGGIGFGGLGFGYGGRGYGYGGRGFGGRGFGGRGIGGRGIGGRGGIGGFGGGRGGGGGRG